MRNPKTLQVVHQSRALAVAVYRLTAKFPAGERFGLTAQIRRAAVAIGSNISEGCGRHGEREFLHSLYLARGEANEVAFQADLAEDLGYLEPGEAKPVLDGVDHLQRMLNRLSSSVRTRTRKTKGASE